MTTPMTVEARPSLVTLTHVLYGLHALGLVLGAFGAASVIGSFLFGWPSIIAVIINYVKRDEVRGTWLDSHFGWQIRTFSWALLWAVISLGPYSFLTYMPRVPSRHTYLPSAGLALLVGAAAALLYADFWARRRALLALLAAAVVVHNAGYIWTRKQRQFQERARMTTELVDLARRTSLAPGFIFAW